MAVALGNPTSCILKAHGLLRLLLPSGVLLLAVLARLIVLSIPNAGHSPFLSFPTLASQLPFSTLGNPVSRSCRHVRTSAVDSSRPAYQRRAEGFVCICPTVDSSCFAKPVPSSQSPIRPSPEPCPYLDVTLARS